MQSEVLVDVQIQVASACQTDIMDSYTRRFGAKWISAEVPNVSFFHNLLVMRLFDPICLDDGMCRGKILQCIVPKLSLNMQETKEAGGTYGFAQGLLVNRITQDLLPL